MSKLERWKSLVVSSISEGWKGLGRSLSVLTYYQRFESITAFVLTILISLIIVVAVLRLASSVISGLVFGVFDPLDPKVFQTVFGEILTLLIALEFNHTLQYTVAREQSIIQTKVVVLVALLAISRKFIILDLNETGAGEMFALAAITLALGITYGITSSVQKGEAAAAALAMGDDRGASG